MLLKENKTNKNKAVTTPQSLFAAYVVLLLFNLLSHTYKQNAVSNAPEQAEEMHKGQQNVIISPWNHFFL